MAKLIPKLILLLSLCLTPNWLTAGAPAKVVVLSLQGAVTPASSDFVSRGLQHAAKQEAQLVVLQMDTPGGLDTSMRQIIKDILASPVPVVSYVSPSGARAASAGTYILYASHIAAMAPGTNLGAATPVQIGGLPTPKEPEKPEKKPGKDEEQAKPDKAKPDKAKEEKDSGQPKDAMTRKMVHDAAAYLRGLAQMRGRNAEWAEQAVREAVSLSAQEALAIKVIDMIADDVPHLLKQLQGRKVTVLGQEKVLETASAVRQNYEPDWRTRLLAVITEPSIAYILMLIGIYGLFFEFSNPGFVLPGVVGAICLLLALFAFQLLPVNYAGLALMILGIAFMVGEAFLPSFGVLGIGGVIAFAIGSVLLIDTGVPGYGIAWPLVMLFAAASALFLVFVVGVALKARTRPVVSGREQLIGSIGQVMEDFDEVGWADIHSERWRIRSKTPLRRGEKIRVTAMDGLILDVMPDSLQKKGE